jgi:hypothetical protein
MEIKVRTSKPILVREPENNFDDYIELGNKASLLVRERIKGTCETMEYEPNYLHSFRVRKLVDDYYYQEDPGCELSLAALLHDIVRDGEVSYGELETMGFPDRTVELIRLCTSTAEIKDSRERWAEMIDRLAEAGDEDARRIKLAEMVDNLTRSSGLASDDWRYMCEIQAPMLLRLGRTGHSAYHQLNWELLKKQKETEAKRRYAVTKWIEGYDYEGLVNDFKLLGEFDNRGDAFVFAVTENEACVRNQLSYYVGWENIERGRPSYSRPNRYNKVIFSRKSSRKDKAGYNSISIFIDVIELPCYASVSENMFDIEDCGCEVRSFFNSDALVGKGDIRCLMNKV